MEISDNARKALKIIFADFSSSYNSHNIREKIGISSVGSRKLLRGLKEKNILAGQRVGNTVLYKANLENDYAVKLLELSFLDHSDLSSFARGWIENLKSFAHESKAILLFGSLLKKGPKAGDVDACFIVKKPENYADIQRKVNDMNEKNRLKIHPLYLTESEFEKKLLEKDPPVTDLVRTCEVVKGQELFVKVVKNVQSRK